MKASIAVLLSLFHLLAVEPAAVVLHCGVTALCVCVLTCITPSQFLSAHSSTQSLKVDSSISSLAGQGEGKKVCLLHFNPHQHSWSSTGSFKTHSFLLSCSGVSVLSCKKRKKKKIIKETRTEASSGSPLCVASSECSCWHPDCREAFMRCSFVGLRDYMSGLNVQCCDAVLQVTMVDRGAAERACKDANPIIDGRKANVNLAYLGAKPRSSQSSKHR